MAVVGNVDERALAIRDALADPEAYARRTAPALARRGIPEAEWAAPGLGQGGGELAQR